MSTARSGLADHRIKPVEHFPTHIQMRPHETFATGLVRPRNTERIADADAERTPILAKPPGWTELGIKCLGDWEEWDKDGDPRSIALRRRAASLCEGCPMAPAAIGGQEGELGPCLSDSMRQEGDVGTQHRYGTRGGLTPAGRAELAKGEVSVGELLYAATHCVNGHRRSELNTYSDGGCRPCHLKRAAGAYKERKAAAS